MDTIDKIIFGTIAAIAIGGITLVILNRNFANRYDQSCIAKGGVPLHTRYDLYCVRPDTFIRN